MTRPISENITGMETKIGNTDASAVLFRTRVAGEAFDRLQITAGGAIKLGSGAAAPVAALAAAGAGFSVGSTSESTTTPIKAIIESGTIAVTVPSIGTVGLGGSVDVSVAALTFAPAVGDQVIATAIAALPTNCYMTGAYVTATDTVRVNFQAIGGTVTGAAVNFNFTFFDLT